MRGRSIRSVAIAVGTVILLGLFASFGATAWLAYQDEVQEATRETENLALVLEKHVRNTFAVVDVTLRSAVHVLEHSEPEFASDSAKLTALLSRIGAGQEEILNLLFVGPDGVARAGAQGIAASVPVSDRSYFIAARDDAESKLIVSEPVHSRAGRGWVVIAARRISGPGGEFRGLVAASIPVDYFRKFYGTLAIGQDGAITLRSRDGIVYARHPGGDDVIGKSTPFTGIVDSVRAGAQQGSIYFPTTGNRLIRFHIVDGLPFIVSVGISKSVIIWRWVESTVGYGVVTLAMAMFIAVLLFGVMREMESRMKSDLASKRSEEAAASARRRLADAMDALPTATLLLDADNRLVGASRRYGEMFPQLAEVAVPGAPFADVLRRIVNSGLVDDENWAEKRLGMHREGSHETELHFTDGRWFRLIVRMTSDGGRVCALEDVTEAKRTQEVLVQAQKMEAVGQLTGGVAHDFNNLLTVILGNAGMMIEDATSDMTRVPAEMIESAALRGAELTQRLLAFSRQQPLAPGGIDMNKLVEGLQSLLNRTIGEDIDITMTLASDLPLALADPGQVENAILNLAINSRDAMPSGGRLSIETARVLLDSDYARHESELKPGAYVMVAVSDTGCGMSPEIQARVFDPFFTTKEVGKGSGLGLSMVYGFAKQSGGHVKIYSEIGLGTTVKLYLPEATSRGEPSVVKPLARPVRGRGEAILVVEDDADVRAYATTALRGLGYTVHEADDGPSAVAKLKELGAVDLLFTDVILPHGMDGGQVAAAAWRQRPDLRVLYASGYTGTAILNQGRLDANARLLNKPYRKTDLAAAVRKALDEVSSRA